MQKRGGAPPPQPPLTFISPFHSTLFHVEPRIRSYSGTRYEMFIRPTSSSAHDLREELSNKNPVVSKTMDLFEAPAFDNMKSAVTSIGSGLFAVRLSAYFIPPITGASFSQSQ